MSETTFPLTPEVTWATGHCSAPPLALLCGGQDQPPGLPRGQSSKCILPPGSLMVIWPPYAEGYSQTDEGKEITICYRPRVMDSFTVNDRAKLVIIVEIAQGVPLLILLCMIPYVLPDCSWVWLWLDFNQLQQYINLKCRSMKHNLKRSRDSMKQMPTRVISLWLGCVWWSFNRGVICCPLTSKYGSVRKRKVCCQPDISLTPNSITLNTKILY